MSDTRDYLEASLGDTVGRVHIAVARDSYLNDSGKIKHKRWAESHYAWPAEADRVEDVILTAAPEADVYVCPYVMRGGSRAKGDAVTHTLSHADVDEGMIDVEKVRTLCGFAVSSGSHGHGHVYVALTEQVTMAQHEALCRGLGRYLGAKDAKISDNDVLRPPGTLNHKPGAGPVRWLVPPTERVPRTPDDLARQLGVTLPSAVVNGKAHAAGVPTRREPVDLAGYPDVAAAINNVTGDRSADTYRVLGACLDARFTFEEAQQAVFSRHDLAEQLDGRDDDLASCWIKLVDKEQKQVQITGDPASDAVNNPPDSGDVTHSAHLGMAIKMGKQFKGKLLYVNKIGWHYWDQKRYAPDGNGVARRAVHSVIKRDRKIVESLQLPFEEQEKRLKQIARYETASAITGILTEAAALEVFSVEVADLDADPWLFNCANGTLDLRTMNLRDHDPTDRITKVANAAYRHDAGVGTEWIRFLEKVLPDEDVRDYTQRLTSLSLLGEVNGDKQIAPITTGSGANGKTTFIESDLLPFG